MLKELALSRSKSHLRDIFGDPGETSERWGRPCRFGVCDQFIWRVDCGTDGGPPLRRCVRGELVGGDCSLSLDLLFPLILCSCLYSGPLYLLVCALVHSGSRLLLCVFICMVVFIGVLWAQWSCRIIVHVVLDV